MIRAITLDDADDLICEASLELDKLTRAELVERKKKTQKLLDQFKNDPVGCFNRFVRMQDKELCMVCFMVEATRKFWHADRKNEEIIRRKNFIIAECDRLILEYDTHTLEWLRNYVLNIDDY